jgi:DNA-directed RNA polymerase specialized sigma24 family protein
VGTPARSATPPEAGNDLVVLQKCPLDDEEAIHGGVPRDHRLPRPRNVTRDRPPPRRGEAPGHARRPRSTEARTLRQRAEQVANENLAALEDEVIGTVRGKLAARKMSLDLSDLEEAYNLAWAGVYEMIKSGKEVDRLTALLVQITWRRAVDSYRSSRPSQHEDVEIADRGVEHDYAADLDDREKLRHLIRRLKVRLNQRECEAVSLCLIRGYTRPEAAERLKLPEPVLQKVMDGAMKKIGGIVTSLSARGCGDDEWARLMRAHAFGLLEESHRDYPRARDHVDECDACRRYVLGLRGIASICPPTLPMLGGHLAAGLALIRDFLRDLFSGTHSGGDRRRPAKRRQRGRRPVGRHLGRNDGCKGASCARCRGGFDGHELRGCPEAPRPCGNRSCGDRS